MGPVPEALDIVRRIALTRPSTPVTAPSTRPQLLDVLPLEIRMLIWKEVLGDQTFHPEHLRKSNLVEAHYVKPKRTVWKQDEGYRLGATYCVAADPSICDFGTPHMVTHGRSACRRRGPDILPHIFPPEVGKLLALLMTCRQI